MLFALLPIAASFSMTCPPLPAAAKVMARLTVRWLVVGETAHGTNEFPRAAACLIRSAMASGRAVHVALEYATRNRPWLDAYLDSDGGDAARAALLSAPLWDPEWADGKSSTAMFGLIEWLRLQHRVSGVAGVIAFDADEGRGTVREERLAQRLRTVDAGRDGIVVVLTGSFHARKRDGGSDPTGYVPAAGRLPADRTFSFRLRGNGGRSWSCRDDGCGVHDLAASTNASGRSRLLMSADEYHDAVLDLGMPTTPSPPLLTPRVGLVGR